MRVIASLLALAALLTAACDGAPENEPETARLYAAASLADVVEEVRGQFEPQRGARIVASLGATSTLAQQVREGAEPGVFIAASAEWADKLEAWGLVESGSRADLAANALVVIVPKGAAARPASLADLADAKFPRIALADPAAVPAGIYAKTALEKAGVFDAVRARIVAAQDVRMALAYVERGEVAAGIVYATDARGAAGVDVAFRVPSELHPRIVYPLLLVKGANRAARDLHAHLMKPEAWAVFERAGFVRP
jgi:molybdate transport system substrate-binding protein